MRLTIPDDLLEDALKALAQHKKYLGHKIRKSREKGRPAGTIRADHRRLHRLDVLTELVERQKGA